MHPSSPHAPARLKARLGNGTAARGATSDPLDELTAEIHGKIAPGSPQAHAHAAAAALSLVRPRRPSSGRAGFRRAPVNR